MTTTITTPKVLLRQDRQDSLEAAGVFGSALNCLLRETAKERHDSRVAAARWAAEEYYLARTALDRDEVGEPTLTLAAGVILWADVIGIGGRDGVEGAATKRHPAFKGCGKGRKHATDGGAWGAAIRTAADQCGGRFLATVSNVGQVGLVYEIEDAGGILVNEMVAEKPWIESILREGLRRAAGLKPWHPEVPFLAAPGPAKIWADLVNEACCTNRPY